MRLIDADALPIWGFGLEWEEGEGVRRCCEAVENAPTINPEQPAWIPCSERLPEVWKEVLVVLNSNGYQSIHIGEMQESGDWMIDDEFWYDKGDPAISHWMKLPELPEKE